MPHCSPMFGGHHSNAIGANQAGNVALTCWIGKID
jgi:hypothetical protein